MIYVVIFKALKDTHSTRKDRILERRPKIELNLSLVCFFFRL